MSLSGNKIKVKHIAFAAMAVALAIATSMIKVIKLPMGGSVTLFSMLFIVLIGYWYGIKVGLTAALAYGVLQLLLDPYILNIPQVLLDYILGFGALGLSGIFSNSRHGLIKRVYSRGYWKIYMFFLVRLDILCRVYTRIF